MSFDIQPSENVRVTASQIIHAVAVHDESLTTLMAKVSDSVSAKDRALLQEIVFGVCRWHSYLEDLHNGLLKRRLDRNNKLAESILKVGIYQLIYMRVPNHAAINETVAAAQELGLTPLKGMINAILRKLQQQNIAPDESNDELSHPAWMRAKIRHNWPEMAEQIFHQNNLHPPMTLRVNPRQFSREDYLKLLQKHAIEAQPCRHAQQGITLSAPCPVTQLPEFESGAVSVQDEAAQLCCELLNLAPSLRLLDACAAPGGKTCAMLERQPDLQLTALDADRLRAARIQENLDRLKLTSNIVVAKAEDLNNWWDGQVYDRILLDAPCSATGVIRRHPDIKLLRKEGDILQLAELQLSLLQALWKTLTPGGTLLYATCSIFPQENSRIIERFIKQESSAMHDPIKADWGIPQLYGRQLLPQKHGHDGFFYARLTKLKNA